jgi:hypothetical protein
LSFLGFFASFFGLSRPFAIVASLSIVDTSMLSASRACDTSLYERDEGPTVGPLVSSDVISARGPLSRPPEDRTRASSRAS